MKLISSRLHGVLDYCLVIVLLSSPLSFDLENPLAGFIYALAGIHFLLTIFTRYELGIIRIIPFTIHGIMEFLVSVMLVLISFWFRKNGNETGYYFNLIIALSILVIFILTDFRKKKRGISG